MKIIFNPQSLSIFFLLTFFLRSGFADVTLKDIETAILEEDYQKAEHVAAEFINSKPEKKDLDEALYFLGLSQLHLEDYQESRKTFNLLLSGFPKGTLRDKAYLGFIDSLYLDGQYEGALKIAQEFLAKAPNSEYLSLAYLKLARSNLKLARWQEAKGYLKKIVNEFPDSLEAYSAKQLLEEKQYFAVQVGAFLDRGRAEKLVSELNQKGEYAYIVETIDRQNQKFYRVRVGKSAVLTEAQQLESKLTRLGYPARIYP